MKLRFVSVKKIHCPHCQCNLNKSAILSLTLFDINCPNCKSRLRFIKGRRTQPIIVLIILISYSVIKTEFIIYIAYSFLIWNLGSVWDIYKNGLYEIDSHNSSVND